MVTSAEVRWFWRGIARSQSMIGFSNPGCHQAAGLRGLTDMSPSGVEPEISLKRRGNKPEFEIKGLVTTRRASELEPLAPHIEVWCKWSCTIPGLSLTDEVALTKTRWLRKFDTSKYVRSEIPLDANEKPKVGHSLPAQGCNVELTEVQIVGHSEVWWTLGFEAFGDLDSVSTNLTLTLMPEKPVLERIVASGAFVSYPAWLLARRRE